MHKRFIRFRESLLVHFEEKLGNENVLFDEQNRVVKFYKTENGKKSLLFQFYPIGNHLVKPGNIWIREDAIDYLFLEVFGEPMPELRLLMYPIQDPKRKEPKLSAVKQEIKSRSEALKIVGDRFSVENIKNRGTWATDKMERLLKNEGIPYIKEFPVVVNQPSKFKNTPKLFVIDFYIPPPFNFIIEVDGGYHDEENQREYDKNRDMALAAKGIGLTIRVKNEQVLDPKFDLLGFLQTKKAFRHAVQRSKEQKRLQRF